jgi:membrane protein DedA with SNARE-associated domain
MDSWIQNLMSYPGIAFLMMLENIVPPLPSEVIMPTAGIRAGGEQLNIVGVIIAGVIGSLAGQLALYYLGAVVGKDRLKRWADKHGSWLALDAGEVDKADKWFDKHGTKAALWGRVVPGIRSLISIPAGLSHMPLPKFLLYSAIGTTLWTTALALLGYFLGQNYESVGRYISPAGKIILGVVLLWFVIQVVKKRREKGEREREGGESARKERTA